MNYIYKPIVRWPREFTSPRTRSPFKASWDSTMRLLSHEVGSLAGENLVFQIAVPPEEFKKDGTLFKNATLKHPGVIVTFTSRHGPIQMPCDTFEGYRDNVRAVALSLEALRRVDRYGVTRSGQQYTGWKQLPGAIIVPAPMTPEEAARILASEADPLGSVDARSSSAAAALHDPKTADFLYRCAAKRLHPDVPGGGVPSAWDRVQKAVAVLRQRHGGGV
jgi:hypothetical protein